MYIKPFAVEEWMNAWETGAQYNIAETCVDSVSVDELFALTGENKNAFLSDFCARRLTYGDIEGAPTFKEGVSKLYRTIRPEHIVPTHGATGANHHVFYSLLSPGDQVVSIMPTYQQLYSIPESYQADVRILHLQQKDGYLPDMEELRSLVTSKTKMICVNNPNNPTGALIDTNMMKQIVDIADHAGSWVLCDEAYRHLTQEDIWCESIADLYDKGISVSSMSKVFSLAGLRLGWIATRDEAVVKACLSHRDYNLISCGIFDEALAAVALRHSDALLDRNCRIVRENLALLDAWVQSEPHVHYIKPQAGTTALVYYDLDVPSYQFCEEMYHKTGAFVTPGDCFEEPNSFRIGYACDKQDLTQGLRAISNYIAYLVKGVL